MNLDEDELEHKAWEMMEFMSKNRQREYNQMDIMEVCNVNIIEAIEISDFLVEKDACRYKNMNSDNNKAHSICLVVWRNYG